MKHLNIILALAQRQLLENRPILALALICGLATLALPFVIGTSTTTANQREFLENIRAGAQVLGMVVSYGVAFYLGISLFGRELSEKRMGFFFSRPISTNTLWIGKLLGAWLLIAGSLLLVWLPAMRFSYFPRVQFELFASNGERLRSFSLNLDEEVYSTRRLPHITFHAFDGMTGTTRSFYHLPEYRKGPTYD